MTSDHPLDDDQPGGMTRRTLIKRSAVVGGTIMWATPVVQSFTSPAFGQVGTPGEGKGISYIALVYQCTGQPPKAVKLDLADGGTFTCSGSAAPNTPQCEGSLTLPAGTVAGSCDDLTIVVAPDRTLVTITPDAGCTILDAVAKCGNPENPASGGECLDGTSAAGVYTFTGCGVD